MPTVVNGIGTWQYGKRRLHSIRDTCESCGQEATLESFDTTLFFVVFFIPIIPLSKQRVLRKCAKCQKYRYIPLAKWEKIKAEDGAEVLERLRQDPDDRDAIMKAIGFATGYQDEPLFDGVVAALASHRIDDAKIQAHLGHAYSFFSRWEDAENAYRRSLAVEDDDAVREQLAFVLIQQMKLDDARPLLQHVIDNRKGESAGLVFHLVKGYQAAGRHDEALEIIDERDEAFPEAAALKAYKEQRKTSTRYRGTSKRIASARFDSAKQGYREGAWSGRAPKVIAALVILGLIALYLGVAAYEGQARKVYFVNGTGRPYTVSVQGTDHTLQPNTATPIRVEEGDVAVAFKDPDIKADPQTHHIETGFWGRPFGNETFVINPDGAAILVEEEGHYAKSNPRPTEVKNVHFGKPLYQFTGLDYKFEGFPASLSVKGSKELTKTRVDLGTDFAPEARVRMAFDMQPQERVEFGRKLLAIDPGQTIFLHLLAKTLPPDDARKLLETRLDDRPLRVEWHRAYQSHMESNHPEVDLKARYQKIADESKGNPDAAYLLGRAEPDPTEREKLYKKAAEMKPPSGYALQGLGFFALSDGRFADARAYLEKALPLISEKLQAEHLYQEALLANRDYDVLLKKIEGMPQTPETRLSNGILLMRLYAIKGDKAQARRKMDELLQPVAPGDRDAIRRVLQRAISLAEGDVAGFLREPSDPPTFEAAFLRGQYKKAAEVAAPAGVDFDATARYGLLYLAATRAKDKALAESSWKDLLKALYGSDRDYKNFAAALAAKEPDVDAAMRLVIDAGVKRVLLAVLAELVPAQANKLNALARKLNYHRDAVALCLNEFLQAKK